jgi:hypothetical protein
MDQRQRLYSAVLTFSQCQQKPNADGEWIGMPNCSTCEVNQIVFGKKLCDLLEDVANEMAGYNPC